MEELERAEALSGQVTALRSRVAGLFISRSFFRDIPVFNPAQPQLHHYIMHCIQRTIIRIDVILMFSGMY